MTINIINNRYRIIKELGQGSMGQVFLVWDKEEEKEIALKTIHSEKIDNDYIRQFRYEFELMTHLSHPHLAKVYDFGTLISDNDMPLSYFFTMEYINGSNIIEVFPNLSEGLQYELIAQFLRALEYIHTRGFIHYDIKPENLLVILDDKSGLPKAKLLDLGLANWMGQTSDSTSNIGGIRGTVYYIAPEVALEKEIDKRADLYSFGMVLYHSATGQLPYQGTSAIEIMRKHIAGKLIPPQRIKPNLSAPLCNLILKLTKVDIYERYKSANESIRYLSQMTSISLDSETEETIESYISTSRLIEREEIYQNLLELLPKKEKKDNKCLIILNGEAGIGKTRLLQELKPQVQLHSIKYYEIFCKPNNIEPLNPFRSFLNKILPNFQSPQERKWLQLYAPYLYTLMSKEQEETYLLPFSPLSSLDPDEEKIRHWEGLCNFIEEWSSRYKTVLVIEQLQWADKLTLELLSYIAHNLRDNKNLLICATWQSKKTEAEKEEKPLLYENYLSSDDYLLFNLTPLTKNGVDELLESMLGNPPEKLSEYLHKETKGNPQLIEEILITLSKEKLLNYHSGKWELISLSNFTLPKNIASALTNKLEKLSPIEKEILNWSVILNQGFILDWLIKIVNSLQPNIVMALRNLIQNQFLQYNKKEHIYTFYNWGLYQIINNNLQADLRKSMHLIMGNMLETNYPDKFLNERAYHFMESAYGEKAIEYTIKNAEQIKKLYSLKKALELYEKAYKIILEQMPEHPKRLEITETLGELYDLVGKKEQAKEKLEEALSIVPEEKIREYYPSLYARLGNYYIKQPNLVLAKEILEKAINLIEDDPTHPALVDVYEQLATLYIYQAQFDEAITISQKVLKIIPTSESESIKILPIYQMLGVAYRYINDLKSAADYWKKGLEISQKLEDLTCIANFNNSLGILYFKLDNLDLASEHWEKALEIAAEQGNLYYQAASHINLINLYIGKQDYPNALTHSQKAIKLSDKMGNAPMFGAAKTLLARIYQIQENYEMFIKIAKEALEINNQTKRLDAQISILINLGMFYNNIEWIEKSEKYLLEALKLSQKGKNKAAESKIKLYIGNKELIQKNYVLAEQNYLDAKEIGEKIKKQYTINNANVYLGLFYIKQGNLEEAQKCLSEIKEIYKKEKSNELEYCIDMLEIYLNNDEETLIKTKKLLEKVRNIFKRLKMLLRIGEILYEQGNYIEAKKHWNTGLEEYKKFIQVINDKELKEHFLQIETIKKIKENLSNIPSKDNIILSENLESLLQQLGGWLQEHINREVQKSTKDLHQQLIKERENLRKLSEVGQAIGKELKQGELLSLMLDHIIEVTKAERGFLMLLEDEELQFKLARDDKQNYIKKEEFAISYSIPYQVLETNKAICIADTGEEVQLSNSIMELKLQSVMCAPLKVRKKNIGILYVDSRTVTQEFTESDLILFESIAELASVSIERAILYEDLREQERLEQELKIAAHIQAGLLPRGSPDITRLEVVGKTIAAKEIGGDYYDFIFPDRPDELYIAIGDVSGKGIPAGLIMSMVKPALHLLVDVYPSTKDIINKLNQIIDKNTDYTQFMTFLLFKWDAIEQKFYYTGAGHEHLIICRNSGELEIIRTGGIALGILSNLEDIAEEKVSENNTLKEKELQLNKGETLVLYTDGITEARDKNGNMLTLANWCELIKKYHNTTPKIMLQSLLDELKSYMSETKQYDDITLVIINKE